MNTHNMLLRAILANPAEDTPRLMYADWCGENGNERRAEFIRVQCRIATRDSYLDLLALYKQERELWPEPVLGGMELVWRRGFVDEIFLNTDEFLAKAASVFGTHPVTKVSLWDREPLDNAGAGEYVGEEPGPADRWYWLRGEQGEDVRRLTPWQIPYELWKPDGDEFTSVKAADSWLSWRCVNYGRSLVNLPPLVNPETLA